VELLAVNLWQLEGSRMRSPVPFGNHIWAQVPCMLSEDRLVSLPLYWLLRQWIVKLLVNSLGKPGFHGEATPRLQFCASDMALAAPARLLRK